MVTVFLDSAVFMYAAGGDHPLRDPCRKIIDRISDGSIDGVSAAVWACTAIDHYRSVPVGFQVPWGQGPFLLAARALRVADTA